MAITPGMGRKTTNKNPPIHQSIQNYADIISCVAMVFVLGLMDYSMSPFPSAFISLHHNVSGEEPTREQIFGKAQIALKQIQVITVQRKWATDYLLCDVLLVVRQCDLEGGLFLQVLFVVGRFPHSSFLHKFYFIIQLAYYLHMLPELYFQKVKAEEQQPKIIHSVCGFSIICLAYTFGFQRIAIVLLTLHYLSEIVAHILQFICVFDSDEKMASVRIVNNAIFVAVRFMVIGVLDLLNGVVDKSSNMLRGYMAFIGLMLQGSFVFFFITEQLKAKREDKRQA